MGEKGERYSARSWSLNLLDMFDGRQLERKIWCMGIQGIP